MHDLFQDLFKNKSVKLNATYAAIQEAHESYVKHARGKDRNVDSTLLRYNTSLLTRKAQTTYFQNILLMCTKLTF